MKIEEIALEEFKNVGDDGLFPNHTDKDIWIAGFKAGFSYLPNIDAIKECEKSPTSRHCWTLPPDSFDVPYCKYCYKTY